ncbi:MAG: hypothetical protein K9G26_02935 [Emcibacter sp.]|nr:hypothetical protein [Emcibacter sp.]
MHNNKQNKACLAVMKTSLILTALLLIYPTIVQARVVEDVDIRQASEGSEIQINFAFPMQYIGHIPDSKGNNVRIQFKVNSLNGLDGTDIKTLSEHSNLTWDHSSAPSVQEIFWEGGNAGSPVLSILFNHDVDFDVSGSHDQRSVTLLIKEVMESPLLAEAMEALKVNDYTKALRLLTKAEATSAGASHKKALEYLGLARQRNNQFAHAKAEYERFLKLYPDGPDAVRVKQRLDALMTANQNAQPKLRQSKLSSPKEDGMWDTSVYGSLSQFYFRDETSPQGGDKRVNVSSLNSNADLNLRMRNKDYDMRFQFVGSHDNDFLDGRDNRKRLSRLFFDFRDKKHGINARLGRQSKSSGGVLGRFDGVDLGYEITSKIKINTVYGYPVQSSRQTNINTDRKFYGASLDFGDFLESWDFTTYFIEQKNKSLLDRRAVGGEVRYFKNGKSLFAMVDYDLHFKELNLIMLNSNWILTENTTVYMSLDYRKNPLLTTTNAIQGEGVENLSDLFDLYTAEEIYLFAQDRTSASKTATFGLNQKLSDHYQLSVDITATNMQGTVTSGQVIGYPGTGTDIYTSVQLLGNNLIFDNDSHIIGVRYNDRDRDRSYTLFMNSRFRIGQSFRLNPRIRIDYKSDKQDSDTRLIIRPLLKMDYRIGKWLYVEFEGGYEWRNETFSGIKQTSSGNYIYMGYRAIF